MKTLNINFGTDKFGRWLVLAEGSHVGSKRTVFCRCNCGTERNVMLTNLTTGISTSCGCYAKERITETHQTHGMSKSNEYRIWQDMLRRCANPDRDEYPRYGGRGISVDPSWLNFSQFYKDMGPRPSTKHSIERLDNNGNYTPQNCKWATNEEQANNKRNTTILVHQGKSKSITEWGLETKLDPETIRNRITNLGWSVEKALETPTTAWTENKQRNYPETRKNTTWLTIDGVTKPLQLFAKQNNINPKVIRDRLKLGWNHKDAATIKPSFANRIGNVT